MSETNELINNTVDTVTFQDVDKFGTYTVLKTFLEKCENPSEQSFIKLVNDFQYIKYLHNPNGPAVTALKTETGELLVEYWINGIPLTEEEARKIENKNSVKNDIKSLVNE